tara:strand:+ start:30 stop:1610 length:1581 start_codon:yes stop_codon:yes gene_type:complete
MKLYDKYVDDLIHLYPSFNDYLNLDKYKHLKHKLENTLDECHLKKQKEFYTKYLKLISKKKRKNVYDKTLLYMCDEALESYKYNYDLIPINHQENFLGYILEWASGESVFSFTKKDDYINFIEKIQVFSDIVISIIDNMKMGIKKRYTMPKIICIKLIEQLEELLSTKTYINNSIKIKLDFDFNDTCESIFVPPLKKLITFLKEEYINYCRTTIGMCGLPNGIKEYKFLVKTATTMSNITVDSIYNYGVQEVNRIYDLMHQIKDKMEFKGSLKEFNNYLNRRKDMNFKSKEELLNTYKKQLSSINRSIMRTQFYDNIKSKCEIIPVPKYNEKFSAEAYYMPGDLDMKRNGKFYINLRDIKENNHMEVESLTLHEANPGHHYQLTYVNENPNIPLFIKIATNDAYQEGWALYCENLGKYKTYESYYGKLILEMIRALRLVVDTGIHYYGWSYDKTFKYYRKYCFDSDYQIHNQLLRYISIPTQALSYKIGERVILDLKQKFKGRAKDFHRKILEHGSLPLDILVSLF